jgi:hypothetical protein
MPNVTAARIEALQVAMSAMEKLTKLDKQTRLAKVIPINKEVAGDFEPLMKAIIKKLHKMEDLLGDYEGTKVTILIGKDTFCVEAEDCDEDGPGDEDEEEDEGEDDDDEGE